MKVYKNKKGRKRCSDGFCDRCSSVGWVEVQQQNPNPCEHNSSSIVSTGTITFWDDSSSSLAEKLSTCINSKSSLILIKVKKKESFILWYLMTKCVACSLLLLEYHKLSSRLPETCFYRKWKGRLNKERMKQSHLYELIKRDRKAAQWCCLF